MTTAEALALLELGPTFTAAELKKACHHTLIVWHPDRFQGNDELLKMAHIRTQEINEAFAVLSLLATDEIRQASIAQTEGAQASPYKAVQRKPQTSNVGMPPQVAKLTSMKPKGSGSSDKTSWIIPGATVLLSVVIVSVLSFRQSRLKDAPSEKVPSLESAGEKPPTEKPSMATTTPAASPKSKVEWESVESLRKAAEQGNALAQFQLGERYFDGKGVSESEDEGKRWIYKAAAQGLAEAQFTVGIWCFEGNMAAKNDAEGVKWVRKAADQDLASAQFYLGQCYVEGKGVVKDETEFVKWTRKSAEQSFVSAQVLMGLIYYEGKGVLKDNRIAHAWVSLALIHADALEEMAADAKRNLSMIESTMTKKEITEALNLATELGAKIKNN